MQIIITSEIYVFPCDIKPTQFFQVNTGSGDLPEVATYIQSNNIPLPFLTMLFLQFFFMLVDR